MIWWMMYYLCICFETNQKNSILSSNPTLVKGQRQQNHLLGIRIWAWNFVEVRWVRWCWKNRCKVKPGDSDTCPIIMTIWLPKRSWRYSGIVHLPDVSWGIVHLPRGGWGKKNMLRKTAGPTLRHLLKVYGWLEYTMIHIPRICNVHITEHWHLHQLLQPPLLLCLCHLSSHEKPKAGVFSMSFLASCSKQCWWKRIFFRQPRGPSPFYCAPGMKYVSRPSHASNNKDMCFIDISYTVYIYN